jgi:glycosyltransferase involved in cell wall biosynthesis
MNVALVAPPGRVPAHAPPASYYRAVPSAAHGLGGALRVLAGAPVQSLLAARYDWRGAISRALDDFGSFDATIVVLSRLDSCVGQLLPPGVHILDAVDSLRRNMAERERRSGPATRWFWREERRRIARVEREAGLRYDHMLAVSDDDAQELGGTTISNGVEIAPLTSAPRQYDFGFWGRLAYFANADAARRLIDEIWPAIRARRPGATLIVGGADAPKRIRAAHGREGITVQSPVPDMAAFARNIKVAIFPVLFGTGQSCKVLEAAEAGCGIVATPKALRALDPLRASSLIADDTAGLATAALALVEDDARRAAASAASRRTVETSFARAEVFERLLALIRRAEAAA